MRCCSETNGTPLRSTGRLWRPPTPHTHTVTRSSRRSSCLDFLEVEVLGEALPLVKVSTCTHHPGSDMQRLSFSWWNMWVFSIHHTHTRSWRRAHTFKDPCSSLSWSPLLVQPVCLLSFSWFGSWNLLPLWLFAAYFHLAGFFIFYFFALLLVFI